MTRRDGLAVASHLRGLRPLRPSSASGDSTALHRAGASSRSAGSYVVVELPESTQIGSHAAGYSGLHTGEYYLAVSEDGEGLDAAWASMEQGYADLFKWLDYPRRGHRGAAGAVSRASTCAMTASDTLSLGELRHLRCLRQYA